MLAWHKACVASARTFRQSSTFSHVAFPLDINFFSKNCVRLLTAPRTPRPPAQLPTRRLAAIWSTANHMDTYDSQWINHWKEGVDPGTRWDAGKCSPMLLKLIQSKELHVKGKKVLVPGCGRGYDVFCFAQAGASPAVGLDLSQEAVAEAAAERDMQLAQHPEAAANVELVADNFFKYKHQSGNRFDVGYDYTFLCALHPDMRKDWATAWSNLIVPGGELVTLIFPVGPGFIGNPPWQVSPELYQELLLPAGFEQVVLEPVPNNMSHQGRGGREWLGRWRRKGDNSCSNGSSSHSAVATSRM